MVTVFAAVLVGNIVLQKADKPPFTFKGVQYIYRYTNDNLHEYTPKSQPDLKKWTDMVTINDYPNVKTGDDLANSANSVLEAYKGHQSRIVKTDSVPRTAKKEAEHLIVAMFPRADFTEVSFTRLLMVDGKGCSLVYSHRIYGKKVGETMSKWLTKNGPGYEKALMSLSPVPKH